MIPTKYTSFAFILGNYNLKHTFVIDLNDAVTKIEDKVKLRSGTLFFRIKNSKIVNPAESTMKIETNEPVDIKILADSVHESVPLLGIAVLPWVATSA